MQVKTYGFEWELTGDIKIGEFLDYLKKESGKKLDSQIIGICKLETEDEVWGGFFLTVKNYRTFTEMEEKIGAKFKISKKAIEAGKSHVDINFFVFNPMRKRGLYQYYHHSAAMSVFGHYIVTKFLSFRSISGKKGVLKPMALFRAEAFEKYLDKFQRIKKVEFETVQYDAVYQDSMQPLAYQADRNKNSLTFFADRIKNHSGIIKSLKNLVQRNFFSTLTVRGSIEGGADEVFKLLNDTEVFSESEYEDFVDTVEIDTDDIENSIKNSANIRKLKAIYDKENVKIVMTIEPKTEG